jgi:predicted PhzF superfamily epimerase YddE/YHI9
VSRADEHYLVITEHGRVVVRVRGDRSGLDADFIDVLSPTASPAGLTMETPLRAFAAKMVDLVEAHAEAPAAWSAGFRAMMVKEKAAEDLTRIERAARRLAEGA